MKRFTARTRRSTPNSEANPSSAPSSPTNDDHERPRRLALRDMKMHDRSRAKLARRDPVVICNEQLRTFSISVAPVRVEPYPLEGVESAIPTPSEAVSSSGARANACLVCLPEYALLVEGSPYFTAAGRDKGRDGNDERASLVVPPLELAGICANRTGSLLTLEAGDLILSATFESASQCEGWYQAMVSALAFLREPSWSQIATVETNRSLRQVLQGCNPGSPTASSPGLTPTPDSIMDVECDATASPPSALRRADSDLGWEEVARKSFGSDMSLDSLPVDEASLVGAQLKVGVSTFTSVARRLNRAPHTSHQAVGALAACKAAAQSPPSPTTSCTSDMVSSPPPPPLGARRSNFQTRRRASSTGHTMGMPHPRRRSISETVLLRVVPPSTPSPRTIGRSSHDVSVRTVDDANIRFPDRSGDIKPRTRVAPARQDSLLGLVGRLIGSSNILRRPRPNSLVLSSRSATTHDPVPSQPLSPNTTTATATATTNSSSSSTSTTAALQASHHTSLANAPIPRAPARTRSVSPQSHLPQACRSASVPEVIRQSTISLDESIHEPEQPTTPTQPTTTMSTVKSASPRALSLLTRRRLNTADAAAAASAAAVAASASASSPSLFRRARTSLSSPNLFNRHSSPTSVAPATLAESTSTTPVYPPSPIDSPASQVQTRISQALNVCSSQADLHEVSTLFVNENGLDTLIVQHKGHDVMSPNSLGVVMAGRRERLVELLAAEEDVDRIYLDTLLLTHPMMMNRIVFFEMLLARFTALPQTSDAAGMAYYVRWKRVIQRKVMAVAHTWMCDYWSDFVQCAGLRERLDRLIALIEAHGFGTAAAHFVSHIKDLEWRQVCDSAKLRTRLIESDWLDRDVVSQPGTPTARTASPAPTSSPQSPLRSGCVTGPMPSTPPPISETAAAAVRAARARPTALLRRPMSILESGMSPQELADALTEHDHAAYRLVPRREFLGDQMRRAADQFYASISDMQGPALEGAAMQDFVMRFDTEAYWCATQALTQLNEVDTVATLEFLVMVGGHCLARNNFFSAAAIVSGLTMDAVRSQDGAWRKMSSNAFNEFSRLRSLVLPLRNMKAYRQHWGGLEEHEPAVPLLPVHMKDLRFIGDGNPSLVNDDMINFDKLRMYTRTVNDLARHQRNTYTNLTCVYGHHCWLRASEACRAHNESDLTRFVGKRFESTV